MIYFKKILINFSTIINKMRLSHYVHYIYYHEVEPKTGYSYQKVQKEKFYKQMNFLFKENYKTILLERLELLDRSKNIINISFDDGFRSVYDIAFPIMRNLGLRFNVFLETAAIDNDPNYLTWDMILEMKDSGLVQFGAHTHTHKDAKFITVENFSEEIFKSNEILRTKIGYEPKHFCFPFGSYDKRTIKQFFDNTEYDALYTSDGRKQKYIKGRALVGRVGISNDDTLDIFVKKIKGDYDLYYRMARLVRVLFRKEKYERFKVS